VSDAPEADPRMLRAEIAREISRLAAKAGRKVIAGLPADDEAARIETLRKIEAALPAERNKLFGVAIAIGALCLIAVSVASTMRVWTTRVQLDLLTNSVSMRLASDLGWTGDRRLKPTRVRLEHFSHFDLPNEYGRLPPLPPNTSLDLIAPTGEIRLTSLTVDDGAIMTLARDQTGAIDFVVRGAPFRGDIDISGEVTLQAEPPPSDPFPIISFGKAEPPGHLGFQFTGKRPSDAGKTLIPAVLHGTPIELPVFKEIQEIAVDGLGFFEERADGRHSNFASQIVSGALTMTDSGEHIPLNEAAALQLVGAKGLISSLKITEKGTQVAFEGTAREVGLGTGAFERNLKPTLLEWLFHQQKLGFVWTALTFLFGLAWSAHSLSAPSK
jgi:hypothetical protein